jgi:hypothetical protein
MRDTALDRAPARILSTDESSGCGGQQRAVAEQLGLVLGVGDSRIGLLASDVTRRFTALTIHTSGGRR